jgi:DNA-binding MarR family transcriptional regulator
MTGQPHYTVVSTWARLVRAQRLALAAIEGRLRAARLPPLAWYDVLLELERAGEQGLRPFELERQLLLAQYNLSRLIERMARAGYVARRPCRDDGRGQVLVITAEGARLRRRMWAVYGPAIQAAIGDRLTAPEIGRLDSLLGALAARPEQ